MLWYSSVPPKNTSILAESLLDTCTKVKKAPTIRQLFASLFSLDFIVEIHSSSLYIAPSGQTTQSTSRSSNAAQLDNTLDKPNNVQQRLSKSDEFATATQKKQTQQLLVSAPPNNEALSTRTAKALGTYASTYNQIPQQQIASTITGIDFYV